VDVVSPPLAQSEPSLSEMDDLDGLIERIEQLTAQPPSGTADRNRAAPREPERGPRPPPGRDRSGGGYWEAADYKDVTSTARR
jgi:hypothetical protein